ncbi:MAG: 50S ribosomal protein L11 [Candidatus Micrarchaeaceae archaeon]|jgi:large subunit ribosomal protein L11
MSEVTITGLVEGGKASSGPPLGPALGPLGVNINGIISEINEKTKQFEGIKIPVKVHVNTTTKTFRIEIGSPTTSALILKELKIQSGAKTKAEVVGNITMEQLKNIAKSKEATIYGKTIAQRICQILGTCQSMGVTCDGENPKIVIAKIKKGELKL